MRHQHRPIERCSSRVIERNTGAHYFSTHGCSLGSCVDPVGLLAKTDITEISSHPDLSTQQSLRLSLGADLV